MFYALHKQYSRRVEIEVEFPQEAEVADYSQLIFAPMIGKIKTLTDKGFGFITPDGGDKDVFFHTSALVDLMFNDLQVGDSVSFEVEESDKGPRAVNVQRA